MVELLVTVGVISLLAAIALPQYQRFAMKTKRAEAITNIRAIHTAQLAYHATADEFATGTMLHVNNRIGIAAGMNQTSFGPAGWSISSYGKFSLSQCVTPGPAGKACGYTVFLQKDLDRQGTAELPEYQDIFRITQNIKAYANKGCPIDEPYHFFDDLTGRYSCLP